MVRTKDIQNFLSPDIGPDVTIHQFKAGPPVFPNRGRGSLLSLKLTSFWSEKNSRKIKSGLQPFQTEAAVTFCLWNWLHFDLRKTHEKSYRACRVVTGGWAGWAIARPVFGRLKGAAGFPSCLWNWLHFDLRKTHYKSNRASSLSKRRPWSNNFLSFQFCHPNHFAAFGESGVNARCRSETKWRLQITSNYLVIKTELFGM